MPRAGLKGGKNEKSKEKLLVSRRNSAVVGILFSGSRSKCLVQKIEVALKELVFRAYPQYREDKDINIMLFRKQGSENLYHRTLLLTAYMILPR